MTIQDQIRLHKEISKKIEELEEQKKLLGASIMKQMMGKSLQIDRFLVRRCSRISISTTLDEARTFNATKMEEVVDKDKIKTIYKSGRPLPGVKEIEYIQISTLEEIPTF